MSETHFDALETRSVAEREKDLFTRLPDLVVSAIANCPAQASRLSGIDPKSLTTREALAKLPVLRKPELMEAQKKNPPFGGFVSNKVTESNTGTGVRLFMSPGPVWEPQATGPDPWQVARAMFAAGIRPGDKIHNAFSYHMTPGGFIMDEGARALGCHVFPAGVGGTEAQVEAANFYQPDVYAGTPDFLKVLLDQAEESGKPLSCIKRGLVSGGALFPSMREEYAKRGVPVLQCYATADLGVIAYESAHEGELQAGMVCNENLIVEIVRPGTDTPVADGEVGELVVTNFNTDYPLIRFGTGDLSAIQADAGQCGRTNKRIAGWLGRADQRTKIKGMFVDPKQVDELVQGFEEIKRAKLHVARDGSSDTMALHVEVAQASDVKVAEVESAMQKIFNLKGSVVVSTNALANDGLVIVDERDYES